MKVRSLPAPNRHCRARPSKRLKAWILEVQAYKCLSCDRRLGDSHYDHIIPLGLGGANTPDNWAALCPTCHRRKTIDDVRRIAKAKRQRRYHETGRSRAPKNGGVFPGPGFDKDWRRHLNGTLTRSCSCPRCDGQPNED
jgi:5-methylcytosine-specific restriction endonuclease McrA